MSGLALIFVVAFGAATLLPLQSEIIFAALQLRGEIALPWLIAVASLGNTAGSVVNYALGWQVERFSDRPWFPAKPAQMARAQVWFGRWGVWALLLSWAPLGDAITLMAGVMRTPFWLFLLLVGFAKTARYGVLAAATAGLFG